MKKSFNIVILFCLFVFSSSCAVYASCPTSSCSGWDNFIGTVYTCAGFTNDPLNPTATFGVECCGWEDAGGTVQLSVGQVVAPIATSTPFLGGCGNNYDAMLVLVNQATTNQPSDYTNISIKVSGYGQVTLGATPLAQACANNADEPLSEGYNFYYALCNDSNLPTSSNPCIAKDPRLICTVPIACGIFQVSGGGSLWNGCYFTLFPPSPPPFCCSIAMPATPPITANICQENSSPSSNNLCVPPSPDAGVGTAPVVNNFFTPSIRVAFDVPSAAFLSVQPWCSIGPNAPGCPTGYASYNTNVTPTAGSIYTVQQCTTTGQKNCVSIPQQTPALTLSTNLEVIYYLPNNPPTSPLLSRYYYQTVNGSPGSLYGINLGNYCDLNYNLVTETSASCSIKDSTGASRKFATYKQCDPNASPTDPMYLYTCSVCVADVTFGGNTGPCSPVPAMPWPTSVVACGTNTPTDFCMNLTFQDGYSGQIKGSIPSSPPGPPPTTNPPTPPTPMIYYYGAISGSQIGLQAIVTDDNYSQPDANGNICLNSQGVPVSTPCPAYTSTYQPGGLYYVNGQYMGGGTQFCYVPKSSPPACPSGCISDCNCVESKLITNSATGSQFASVLISDRVSPASPPAYPLDQTSLATIFPSSGKGVRGVNSLEAGFCVTIPLPPPPPPPSPSPPSNG